VRWIEIDQRLASLAAHHHTRRFEVTCLPGLSTVAYTIADVLRVATWRLRQRRFAAA
jgi:hypothetical protein